MLENCNSRQSILVYTGADYFFLTKIFEEIVGLL